MAKAVAVLVALLCFPVAVQAHQSPAAGGAPVCEFVDQDVVNACFKSFGEARKIATADRYLSEGHIIKVDVDCCVAFGGHSCLCQMKKVWEAKGTTAQNNVKCVRDKAC